MNVEEIMKTLKDATTAVVDAKAVNKEEISKQVEQTIKDILSKHPGFTPERKIAFEENKELPTAKKDLLKGMTAVQSVDHDNLIIVSKLLNRPVKSLKSWDEFKTKNDGFIKAMDTATSGEGQEWVPTELSTQLMELVRLELKVAALFPVITMPSNPYELPIQLGRFLSYKHAEQTETTGQTKITKHPTAGTTGKTIFTAVPHGVEVLASDEITEDSVVPILPFVQKEIIKTLAEGREDAILNGDTGTHEDSDVTGSTNRKTLWIGLRAMAHDQTYTRDLATLTLQNLRFMRSDMGKYGVQPSKLAWIVGIKGYIKLLGLDEVITIDKYGPNATILSGELGKVDGIPIIVSEFQREDLNSSGVFQAGQTKTVMNLVWRDGFAMGQRKTGTVTILRELYAESSQIAMITRERVHFRDMYPIASNRTINLGQNVG